MQRGLVFVDEVHELADAALVTHRLAHGLLAALVGDGDAQAGVQKRLLAHAHVQRLIVVDRVLEHDGVGLEAHGRAGVVRLADDGHGLRDIAAGKLHLIDLPVFVHVHFQPLGQGVDDRGADAVQAAGDLIATAAELAARVQHGEHHLERGLAGLRLDVHGDAAAVIADADDVAGLDGELDVAAVARERLVNGVVDDLIHQVVQAGRRRGADVHTRAFADGLQTLENLDLTGIVLLCDLICNIWHGLLPSVQRRGSEIFKSAGLAAFI